MLLFRTILLALLLPGIAYDPLLAQDNRWFHFAPNDRILNMVEDGNDLWVHTVDGLVAFHTKTGDFNYFDKTNSQLGSEYIHGLARIGGGGTVVVVTYDLGLIRIADGGWTYFNTTNSPLPANDLISVSEDRQGGAWMITESLPRLIRYDGQRWTVITIPDSGMADPSQVVYVDHEDRVWVGTQSRLLSYDGVKWQDHSVELTTAGCFWLSVDYLYEDRQQRLWAGISGELYRRDPSGAWQLIAQGIDVGNMGEDAVGALWLTRNLGSSYQLMRYDEAAAVVVPAQTTHANIPFDAYASLYQAREGSLWMGAYPGELTRYRNNHWQHFDLANSQLKTRKTSDITRDEAGNMFLLHEGQIDWYDGDRWQHIPLPTGLRPDRMAVLHPNHLWVLDRTVPAARISMYFHGQWAHFDAGSFFPAGTKLRGLGIDGNGVLWVQEAHSIYRLAGNQWTHFVPENSLLPAGATVAAMTPASQGGMWWAGPETAYLHYFDGNQLLSYANPFAGTGITSQIRLHAGENGDVWLYNGLHLLHFDGTTFRSIPAYHGGAWQGVNALSSQGDTLIASSGYNIFFHHENALTVFNPYNSPLRNGWPGKVLRDAAGNFWITNLWASKGGLTLYRPGGVVYEENQLSSALSPANKTTRYHLRAAPSRFAGATDLLYTLPASGPVQIDLYDTGGRHLSRLAEGFQPQGNYRQRLSAEKLNPGLYFVRLRQGQWSETQKIIRLPD